MEQMNFVQLSKSFFMSLNGGVFLISNTGKDKNTPYFAEYVVSQEKREEQWEKIRKARVDQRKCHVFPSKIEFKKWVRSAEREEVIDDTTN